MKQLTIEHLSAYLPYGVKVVPIYGGYGILEADNIDHILRSKKPARMALRPLSDLTKQITHNGGTFVPLNWIHENTPIKAVLCTDTEGKAGLFCDNIQSSHYNAWPHSLVRTLLHLHFDVYNLIEAGLAIDINTLSK